VVAVLEQRDLRPSPPPNAELRAALDSTEPSASQRRPAVSQGSKQAGAVGIIAPGRSPVACTTATARLLASVGDGWSRILGLPGQAALQPSGMWRAQLAAWPERPTVARQSRMSPDPTGKCANGDNQSDAQTRV
jgi:hypothetical protein